MENLKILIVKSNLSFAIELEMLLLKWGCKNINIVDNGIEAFAILESSMIDIILMDIDINGSLNGIQVAEKIQNTGIPIIYITGQKSEEYYERAKNTNLSSYIVKPFNSLTLKSAIETSMVSKPCETEEDIQYFYVRRGKILKKILIEDIYLVISDANYCDLYHDSFKSTVKSSLKKILHQLPERDFIRVHNQYIVQVNKINEIFLTKGEILINDMIIPIGRSFKKQLKERLNVL